MENKLQKSECESRVYARMKEARTDSTELTDEQKREAFLMSKRKTRRLSSAHVDLLPYVKSPLPIALALIADYLADHRLRLLDLFNKVDKNKDWQMTRDELKRAFKRIKIPLCDGQLDHLIYALDVNNDDQLSYKEVARGIDTYHRDRRYACALFSFSSYFPNIIQWSRFIEIYRVGLKSVRSFPRLSKVRYIESAKLDKAWFSLCENYLLHDNFSTK